MRFLLILRRHWGTEIGMIIIKDEHALQKIREAGRRVAQILHDVRNILEAGISTLQIDSWIAEQLKKHELVSQSQGYRGYRHVSCISINKEVVHGIPHERKILKSGDLVTVDVCAAWQGYCADAARTYIVGEGSQQAHMLIDAAQRALDAGISKAVVGGRLGDISAAVQREVEQAGYAVIRDFCGHGIGANMHEEPEILNYGTPGRGAVLKAGMVFAIEPMIAAGSHEVQIEADGWTATTVDGSLAAHIEDTVIITESGPEVVTRRKDEGLYET